MSEQYSTGLAANPRISRAALMCRLGAHGVAFSPVHRTLALLNPAAVLIWELLDAGLTEEETASELVSAFGIDAAQARADLSLIFEAWLAAGLTETVEPEPPQRPSADGAESRFLLRLHRRTALVRSWLPRGSRAILARLLHRESLDAAPDFELQFHPGPDGPELWRDGVRLAAAPDPDALSGYVYEELLSGDCEPGRLLAYFHSAAVEWNGRCLLLCGRSGSGKTTLSAALTARGALYLGDELSAADDDGRVRALPTRLAVKTTGRAIIEKYFGALGARCPYPPERTRVWYWDLASKAPSAASSARPPVFLFPRYRAAAALEIEPLDAVASMQRLLRCGIALGAPVTLARLRACAQFVADTPAYRIVYSDAEEAIDGIARLVAHG